MDSNLVALCWIGKETIFSTKYMYISRKNKGKICTIEHQRPSVHNRFNDYFACFDYYMNLGNVKYSAGTIQ